MGWLSLGSIRDVAFRANVTLVIGALAFGLFHFAPGAWLAYVAVIVVHELGHAAFIGLSGRRVAGVDIHALGGSCQWSGRATLLERATIAWGGVIAQLALFGVALATSAILPRPDSPFLLQIVSALLWPNLVVAGLNLLPLRMLDGAEAWRLPGALLRRRRAVRRVRPALLLGPADRIAEEVLDRACEIVEREAEEARSRRLTKS